MNDRIILKIYTKIKPILVLYSLIFIIINRIVFFMPFTIDFTLRNINNIIL